MKERKQRSCGVKVSYRGNMERKQMEKVRLGDVCKIVSGSTPKTNIEEYWNGDIIWITPAELDDETCVIEDSARKITRLGFDQTGLQLFPAGTVILSSRAPIGKVAIAGKEMCCNQGFKNLICSEKIHNEYLYWFLKEKKEYLNLLGRGATFKEISKTIVENIEINLPCIQEQKYISTLLRKNWNIIEEKKREIQLLDMLVESRFSEMFRNEKKYMFMCDLCSMITDGTHQPPVFIREGIPFIFVSNITGNKVTYETEKFVSNETYMELIKHTPIEIGDVLLSTVGSYGHADVVKSDKKFLFQRHIAYLKPKREIVDSDYLHSALLASEAQRQIEEGVKGIAQKTLNLSVVRKISIPVPDIDRQKEFSSFVKQITKLKLSIQKSLDETQLLFDSLMQKFFESSFWRKLSIERIYSRIL